MEVGIFAIEKLSNYKYTRKLGKRFNIGAK